MLESLLSIIKSLLKKSPPSAPIIAPPMKRILQKDYLMGRIQITELPPDQLSNLNNLLDRVNKLLTAFGSYRGCNSGYRSLASHKATYAEINKHRQEQGLAPVSIPMGSRHLMAAAIDLEDKDGKLKDFAFNNTALLESLGLWCEMPSATPTWLHVQIFPPKSGKRWFLP